MDRGRASQFGLEVSVRLSLPGRCVCIPQPCSQQCVRRGGAPSTEQVPPGPGCVPACPAWEGPGVPSWKRITCTPSRVNKLRTARGCEAGVGLGRGWAVTVGDRGRSARAGASVRRSQEGLGPCGRSLRKVPALPAAGDQFQACGPRRGRRGPEDPQRARAGSRGGAGTQPSARTPVPGSSPALTPGRDPARPHEPQQPRPLIPAGLTSSTTAGRHGSAPRQPRAPPRTAPPARSGGDDLGTAGVGNPGSHSRSPECRT